MRAITESDLLKLYNYLALREGNDSGENPKLGILQYTIFVLSFLCSAASSSPTTWVAKLLKRKAQKYGNVRPFRLHRNDFFHFLCPLRAILRYTFVVTSDTFCPKAWPDLTSPLFFGIAKKRRFTPGKKLLLSKTING